jgi:hypothetical protein
MAITRFTEAYAKARELVGKPGFSEDIKDVITKLKSLLAEEGPQASEASSVEVLRRKIAELAKDEGGAHAAGAAILSASKSGTANADERAAMLKMMKHLYLGKVCGGQKVWVYSPPEAYSKWIFEEIKDKTTEADKKKFLSEEEETYTAEDKKIMGDAVRVALKWSQLAAAKVGAGKKASHHTKDLVKQWFADEDTTDADLEAAMAKLKTGYQSIAAACNSNLLIFSDEPIDRKGGGWKDWAFVSTAVDKANSTTMRVVYLQGAFIKFGRAGMKKHFKTKGSKLWKCALTIIHELSHLVVGTKDNMYDSKGLKPSKTKAARTVAQGGEGGMFVHARALNNADTWGYFATDAAGHLTDGERGGVLT